jgi:hypothetical protein
VPGFSIQTHADGSLRDDWPDSDVINVLSRDFNALQEPFFKEVGIGKFQAGCRLNIKSYAAILSGLTTSWGELFWVSA